MGVVVARRIAKDVSVFKTFIKGILKVCDPDEVWISSGYYYRNFWYTNDKGTDTLTDLLKNRKVVLVGDPRITKDIKNFKYGLQKAIGSGTVEIYVYEQADSNFRANEIHFFKNNRDVAFIVGSSSCTKRDLDFYRTKNSNTDFDIQSDVVKFDSLYDADMMTYLDVELCDAKPDLISIDILGIDRRLELQDRNKDFRTFITSSGLFNKA